MMVQALFAMLSGGLVGLLLGATGGGGTLIALPLLVYVVGIPLQHATAMSLMVVGYSALFGALQAQRQGLVNVPVALIFSSTGVIGAWVGAQAHRLVSHHIILLLLGLLLIGICLWTLGSHGSRLRDIGSSDTPPQPLFSSDLIVKGTLIGFGVGVVTGFFGIGGGFLMVPALMLILGFPMRLAVGTSFLIIAVTSIGGIIGHLDMNHLDFSLTGLVILGSLIGMVAGSWITTRLEETMRRQTFAVVVGITGLFVLIDNGWRLLAMGF